MVIVTFLFFFLFQFYDSSFSTQTKITNTDPFENGGNDTISVITKTKAPIKMEYDDHIKAEVIYIIISINVINIVYI